MTDPSQESPRTEKNAESPREQMEERARAIHQHIMEWPGHAKVHCCHKCNVIADFAASEVLRALHECAKLVCPLCADGLKVINTTFGLAHQWGEERLPCHATKIHAKIASLTSGQETK